jgi:DNA-binding GntR family transcriptional regulator
MKSREQIVTGRLADNAPIRLDALSAELGISRIPLREARPGRSRVG